MAIGESLNDLLKTFFGERIGLALGSALDSFFLAKSGGTLTGGTVSGGTVSGTTTLDEGANLVGGTETGTKIGTAVTQKFGFWNATPVIQQANAAQAIIVAATYAAPDASEVDGTYGAEEAAVIASLRTQLIALAADVATHKTLVNRLRLDLITTGIIKGAA